MGKIKRFIIRAQDAALCLARKWWRPLTCLGIAGGTITNLIIIPLVTMQVPDMTQAATFITAATAAFAVRTYEKVKGVAEPQT